MSLDDKLNVAAQLVDSQFIEGTQVQYAWDSVSITSMLACPRRYKYQILDGLVPNGPARRIELLFGIQFHKALEYYHKARVDLDHHDAVKRAVKMILAEEPTQSLPTDEEVDEAKESTDEDDDGISHRNSKIRTRYYLIRAVVWYLEHYREDSCETIILQSGAPAVELSFRVPLQIDVLGTPMLLCGHIDRGVVFNDRYYAADYKTTKSITHQWKEMFELSHQMTGYTIAGSTIFPEPAKGVMIDGVALQVGQTKFGRSFTLRTQGQIEEYFETLRGVRDSAIRAAETGHYPMNTSACYFCEFKPICAQPPEYRDRFIKQHYKSLPGWNPLENR